MAVVCVSCKRLRVSGKWTRRVAGKKGLKFYGRVICPNCGPQDCESANARKELDERR